MESHLRRLNSREVFKERAAKKAHLVVEEFPAPTEEGNAHLASMHARRVLKSVLLFLKGPKNARGRHPESTARQPEKSGRKRAATPDLTQNQPFQTLDFPIKPNGEVRKREGV